MTLDYDIIVIGGGHSIGIPIAVSCGRSFIVPSATMTIHPVRTSGTVLGVPQAFAGDDGYGENGGHVLQPGRRRSS